MATRNLMKDVSIDEMMRMRESGMTNQDIANALGCSYSAVYNRIGKQPYAHHGVAEKVVLPPKVRAAELKAVSSPAASIVEKPPVNGPEASLVVEDRTVSLTGLCASYVVSSKEKRVLVCISPDGPSFCMDFADIEAFAAELSAIRDRLNSLALTNEMW
ncbi:MAG: hypothetical protein K6G54_07375 [Oscillospiraceae bacterium]|nr:hypothetical protein [Oscillospiraceae bacterium]